MDPSSPEPLKGSLEPSSPPIVSSDLGVLPDSTPRPTLLPTSLRTFPRLFSPSPEPSNDPLITTQPLFPRTAGSHCLSRIPNRKRGLSSLGFDYTYTNKEIRTSIEPKTAKELVLQAKDLLVQAYSNTDSRDKQGKLLDLIEIFREYTEKGRIQAISSILTS